MLRILQNRKSANLNLIHFQPQEKVEWRYHSYPFINQAAYSKFLEIPSYGIWIIRCFNSMKCWFSIQMINDFLSIHSILQFDYFSSHFRILAIFGGDENITEDNGKICNMHIVCEFFSSRPWYRSSFRPKFFI